MQTFLPRVGTCALCNKPGPMQLSHLIPKFAANWIKETSATGRFRTATDPNRAEQDIQKDYLLCEDCERLMSRWETPFANSVFLPLVNSGVTGFEYDESTRKFAVAVCWRVLTWFSLRGALRHASVDQQRRLKFALKVWKDYMEERRRDVGPYDLHIAVFPMVQSTTVRDTPAHFNHYLMRAVDMDAPARRGQMFVYAKMPAIMILGFIQKDRGWDSGLLEERGRIAASTTQVFPRSFGEYLLERATVIDNILTSMSQNQHSVVLDRMTRDTDKLLNSGTWEAMEADETLKVRPAAQKRKIEN